MIDILKAALAKGDHYKALVKAVFEHPYAEKKDIFKELSLDAEALEQILAELEEAMIVLSLTSQADSSIESRVPKHILLINPDLENEIDAYL